jgi:hypothetical protein
MKPATPRAILTFFALSFLLCANATAQDEEAAGVHFEHGDWEVACDNTLTCRIAGYCAGEGGGSVLITRAAGPNAPLEGKVRLENWANDNLDAHILTLQIDGQSKGKLKRPKDGAYSLTPAQIRALLAAARKDGVVEFVGEIKSFTLSGNGVSAVLLKADEVQGRIGTPGALIRKGDKPEESVSPPRPVPVIRAAKVSDAPSRGLTAPEIAALQPMLLQSVKGECDYFETNPETTYLTLTPLDERHVLINTMCWTGAYNACDVYWVVDSTFKKPPKLVDTYVVKYEAGTIYGRYRGRGPGDCWIGSDRVWDGRKFRLTAEWRTGYCRLLRFGGTWYLPTFVAKVRNADGTPRAPSQIVIPE